MHMGVMLGMEMMLKAPEFCQEFALAARAEIQVAGADNQIVGAELLAALMETWKGEADGTER